MARAKRKTVTPRVTRVLIIGIFCAVAVAVAIYLYRRRRMEGFMSKGFAKAANYITENTKQNDLILYPKTDYAGDGFIIKNQSDLDNMNATIKSAKIPDGMKLIIKDKCKGGGGKEKRVFTGNIPKFVLCDNEDGIKIDKKSKIELVNTATNTVSNTSKSNTVVSYSKPVVPQITEPSMAFPVILYSDTDFKGTSTPVTLDGAANIDKLLVKSMKIYANFFVTFLDPKCNGDVLKRTFLGNTSRLEVCAGVTGVNVRKGSLSIQSHWKNALQWVQNVNQDWQLISNWTHTISASYDGAGTKGVYVAFYNTMDGTPLIPSQTNSTIKPPNRTSKLHHNIHYSDDIMNLIDFNTVRVWVKSSNDQGATYTFTRSSNPDLFTNRSVLAILNRVSANDPGRNPTVKEDGVLKIAPYRDISVRVEL